MKQLSLIWDWSLPLEVLTGWCWGNQTILLWTPKDSFSPEKTFVFYEITMDNKWNGKRTNLTGTTANKEGFFVSKKYVLWLFMTLEELADLQLKKFKLLWSTRAGQQHSCQKGLLHYTPFSQDLMVPNLWNVQCLVLKYCRTKILRTITAWVLCYKQNWQATREWEWLKKHQTVFKIKPLLALFSVFKLLFIFLMRNYCITDQCPKMSISISRCSRNIVIQLN